ncbi:ABC transporter substrate-binding protein [Microvirga rosea]|uniref:ABC transporter substrate-binding protein n=1 Tax=Microvirga rosea TaxID=2715425 RepID=UPI001D0B6970|nr:ABC transporter substrate-binding protein [Microvirga rosea]MCB8823508.1 ABC transporter substrate-binding protein [Microvirga rosea]
MKRLLTASLLALLSGTAFAAPSGKLVVYTSQTPEVAQQTIDAFKAKYPDVAVEWIRNGTAQLMNILRAEVAAGDVKPDVLFVADTINIGQLKREGRLLPYAEAPTTPYDKAFHDADRTYFGTKIVATGIAYNTKTAKRPTSWSDLTAPSIKAQVALPSPLYSGAALNHLHTVAASPEIGWSFYAALAKNGVAPVGGNGPALNDVAGGRATYGIIADGDVMRAKANGSPVDFVYPKEGVSYITEPAAILKTARNIEAAKAFIDFLLSKEAQQLVARQGNIPIHPEVPAPEGFPKLTDIKLLPLDVGQAINTDKEVKEKFRDIFGG